MIHEVATTPSVDQTELTELTYSLTRPPEGNIGLKKETTPGYSLTYDPEGNSRMKKETLPIA